MASIKFKLRTSIKLGKQASLYIQLIHQRRVKTITLPYKLYSHEWEPLNEEIILQNDNMRFNYLKEVQQEILKSKQLLHSIIYQLEQRHSFTTNDILSHYNNRQSGNFFPFMQKQIKELLQRGKNHTARNYQTTLRTFQSFCERSEIYFKDINSNMIKKFENYLKQKNIQPNTISFYMRTLRAVYNKALVEDHLLKDENPFRFVYTGIPKTNKRAVNASVIQQLIDLHLSSNKSLSFARDLFLFSFYTRGMAFIDMAFLLKSSIRDNYLVYTRHKTRQTLTIKLVPEILDIIKKYSAITDKHYLLPIITKTHIPIHRQYESAQRLYNKRLKILSDILQISPALTSYVARHSWATIAHHKGIPLSVISQGMGHTSTHTTNIYLASLDHSVIDKANEEIIAL
ncbi:site-specific integrase [Butyricimonas hominis]|uniref:tyrosine-type recombinase/integrase n=1 Tax=Butyricimonas hominis TaxID=2763032 RepID=UPI0035161E94